MGDGPESPNRSEPNSTVVECLRRHGGGHTTLRRAHRRQPPVTESSRGRLVAEPSFRGIFGSYGVVETFVRAFHFESRVRFGKPSLRESHMDQGYGKLSADIPKFARSEPRISAQPAS